MITGVIGLEFKDGTSEETIQEIVSQIYAQNRNCIQNMQYFEFEDPKTLSQLYEFCRKDEIKDTKEKWKCPVCNAEHTDGQAVEHAKDCDYCEKKINQMLAKNEVDKQYHDPIPFISVPCQDISKSKVKKLLRFEIMQPSDKCFVEGDDFKTVCIATIILGEGKYGLQEVDGELHMPPVIFSTHWFKTAFGETEKEAIQLIDPMKLIPIFKSVKLAGKISSLNDIEGRAKELASFLEDRTKPKKKEGQT